MDVSESWRLELAERKISTFTELHADNKITYGDAILVLTAVISALASQCWPGKSLDRCRFNQLLVDYAPETRTISVPLLMKHFESNGKTDLASTLKSHFDSCIPLGSIPRGDIVDLSEKDVEKLLGAPCRIEVRKHSYANLLYEELRCSYSHEFKPGDRVRVHRPSWLYLEPGVFYQPYSRRDSNISENPLEPSSYQIYFDLTWIGKVLKKCSIAVDKAAKRLRRKPPIKWWITGGRCYYSRSTDDEE
jgi:hypothetical protein